MGLGIWDLEFGSQVKFPITNSKFLNLHHELLADKIGTI